MMSFKNQMRDCVRMYRRMIKEAEADTAAKREYYAIDRGRLAKEKLDKAKEEEERLKAGCLAELEEIHKSFLASLDKRYMPSADQITEDARLFSSGIKLTKAELNDYFEKFHKAKNPTMLRLATDYAKQNGIEVDPGYLVDWKAEKANAAGMVLTCCKSAMSDTAYYDIVIESDENFEKICTKFLAEE